MDLEKCKNVVGKTIIKPSPTLPEIGGMVPIPKMDGLRLFEPRIPVFLTQLQSNPLAGW